MLWYDGRWLDFWLVADIDDQLRDHIGLTFLALRIQSDEVTDGTNFSNADVLSRLNIKLFGTAQHFPIWWS
jgi:hypothetical protein